MRIVRFAFGPFVNFYEILSRFDLSVVLHFRNDGIEDQYSILIRFDDQNSADAFHQHFNGRRFSSLEVCFFPNDHTC